MSGEGCVVGGEWGVAIVELRVVMVGGLGVCVVPLVLGGAVLDCTRMMFVRY